MPSTCNMVCLNTNSVALLPVERVIQCDIFYLLLVLCNYLGEVKIKKTMYNA